MRSFVRPVSPNLIAVLELRDRAAEDETHELFDLCFKRVGQIWWEVDTDGTEGQSSGKVSS